MGVKVLSLFDGISCGRVALEKAGIKIDEYYSCEIDKDALAIQKKHFPDNIQLGNVFDVNFKELGKIDLLIGGSPCNYWSVARGKKTEEVIQTGIGLFDKFAEAKDILKPDFFVYENVARLKNGIARYISNKLKSCTYVLNSADFSPQQRTRLYWNNFKIDIDYKNCNSSLDEILENGFALQQKAFCLTASYYKATNYDFFIKRKHSMVANFLYEDNKSLKEKAIFYEKTGNYKKNIFCIKDGLINFTVPGQKGNIICHSFPVNKHDGIVALRKLTPLEAERLQGLPDNYTDGLADYKRYRLIGNGWSVQTMSVIFKSIKRTIRGRVCCGYR